MLYYVHVPLANLEQRKELNEQEATATVYVYDDIISELTLETF